MIDPKELEKIARQLRRMINLEDESVPERLISDAIVYLDCARFNLEGQGVYRVAPQVTTDYARPPAAQPGQKAEAK